MPTIVPIDYGAVLSSTITHQYLLITGIIATIFLLIMIKEGNNNSPRIHYEPDFFDLLGFLTFPFTVGIWYMYAEEKQRIKREESD